jgi:hypothetical protein
MNFYCETRKNAPSMTQVPKELRNRDVEIIILPLDEKTENGNAIEVDKNGYPIVFFLSELSAVCRIFPTANRNRFSPTARKLNDLFIEVFTRLKSGGKNLKIMQKFFR